MLKVNYFKTTKYFFLHEATSTMTCSANTLLKEVFK